MSSPQAQSFLSISQFSARTGLSIKALRLYDASGLLRPGYVEPANGYRRYALHQIEVGRLIALLRGIDMGLSDIAALVSAIAGGGDAASQHLALHMRRLNAEHEGRQALSQHINAILKREELTMFPVHTRTVAACRGMSIVRRLHGDKTDAFVEEAKAAFTKHLGCATPTGPFTLIFHGRVDSENDGPLEAFLGCPDDILPTDAIGVRTEPAHDEAYTRITKAQWAFPAILAAYDAVASSPIAMARDGSTLSCREVYLAEPDQIDLESEICDIAFPLT